ncbi:hypothetical protein A0O36_02586 [Piscirickettsiaceae bacterium NZ-RLO1]|nr:hypothetical protein A0O36_02586 [Piscirickettsiaceae bacterium NZ-RLO1]
MAIRWYVAYTLSYRDIEELMAERAIQVNHSTIHRWVVKYASQLEGHFSADIVRLQASKISGKLFCLGCFFIFT